MRTQSVFPQLSVNTTNGAYRLAFIKDVPNREPKEVAFKRKIEKDVTRNPVLFGSL